MSFVVCESYGVQLRPAVGLLVVRYGVRLYGTTSTSIARLILNTVRLTHNTRHDAKTPNVYKEVNQ